MLFDGEVIWSSVTRGTTPLAVNASKRVGPAGIGREADARATGGPATSVTRTARIRPTDVGALARDFVGTTPSIQVECLARHADAQAGERLARLKRFPWLQAAR